MEDGSPLKKKDLLNDFACEDSALGGGSLKEQECETDEEEEGEKKEKIKERTNSNFSQMIAWKTYVSHQIGSLHIWLQVYFKIINLPNIQIT